MSSEAAPHDVDAFVGARIRSLRLAGKVSQEALASALGLSFQQVQKYEKGKNRVSASKLFEIAGALDVPVAELFPSREGGDPAAAELRVLDAEILRSVSAVPEIAQVHRLPGQARRAIGALIAVFLHGLDEATDAA